MRERDFQIQFERQLQTLIPGYNTTTKLNSDTIFSYINRAKDEYVKQLYRVFQQNQEITDKLRTLVDKTIYTKSDFMVEDNRWSTSYPNNYLFALGEETFIDIYSNACPLLVSQNQGRIRSYHRNSRQNSRKQFVRIPPPPQSSQTCSPIYGEQNSIDY